VRTGRDALIKLIRDRLTDGIRELHYPLHEHLGHALLSGFVSTDAIRRCIEQQLEKLETIDHINELPMPDGWEGLSEEEQEAAMRVTRGLSPPVSNVSVSRDVNDPEKLVVDAKVNASVPASYVTITLDPNEG
jgi:hypothetical protein